MRDSNIFYRVADSEVPFTELFCNLMSYQVFRNSVFEKIIGEKYNCKYLEYDDFSTQFRLPNQYGQPDICIKNDDIEILIEIKINNSALTKNQPVNYLNHLKTQNKKTLLVFIIPPKYSHKETLVSRFNGTPDCNYKIITWNDILNDLKESGIHDINKIISEFTNLLTSWFNPEVTTFNPVEITYMFSNSIPTILEKLYAIVDSTKDATAPICKSNKGQSREYGLNFQNKDGEHFLYFGVWNDFWQKHDKPLIYGVHKDYPEKVIERFCRNHKTKLIKMDSWHMTWFDQVDFDDPSIIIKTIQAELDDLKDIA